MDNDFLKTVALISGILTILEKVYTYAKSAYDLKKTNSCTIMFGETLFRVASKLLATNQPATRNILSRR